MYVMCQDGETIVNWNHVESCFVDHVKGDIVWACFGTDPVCADGNLIKLGEYENKSRCKEIVNELLRFACANEIVDRNFFCNAYKCRGNISSRYTLNGYMEENVFYMPEK